ncbi:MAG: hypothetical protein ACD_62C00460G0007 [uncultured bacterium]|nr:MAG: hypothetical protein ACD_62C00460G0007 [uncultured bacterium]
MATAVSTYDHRSVQEVMDTLLDYSFLEILSRRSRGVTRDERTEKKGAINDYGLGNQSRCDCRLYAAPNVYGTPTEHSSNGAERAGCACDLYVPDSGKMSLEEKVLLIGLGVGPFMENWRTVTIENQTETHHTRDSYTFADHPTKILSLVKTNVINSREITREQEIFIRTPMRHCENFPDENGHMTCDVVSEYQTAVDVSAKHSKMVEFTFNARGSAETCRLRLTKDDDSANTYPNYQCGSMSLDTALKGIFEFLDLS